LVCGLEKLKFGQIQVREMSTCKSNSTFLSFYFAPFSQIFNPPGTEAGQRKIRKGMVTFLLHLAAKKQCSETAGLFAAVP